jgi:hypothetical protein
LKISVLWDVVLCSLIETDGRCRDSSCRCDEIMSPNCGHKRAYYTSPRYMIMESYRGMTLTGENRRIRRRTQIPHGLTRERTRTSDKLPEPWHGVQRCKLSLVRTMIGPSWEDSVPPPHSHAHHFHIYLIPHFLLFISRDEG